MDKSDFVAALEAHKADPLAKHSPVIMTILDVLLAGLGAKEDEPEAPAPDPVKEPPANV